MIHVSKLSEFVVNLKGLVTEPSRTVIAARLTVLLGESFRDTEYAIPWAERGCQQFLNNCKLTCPEKWVDDNLTVSETALAAFCNKWMQVSHFKLAGTEEYSVMNPELNGLRYTMVEELKSLSKAGQ